jgi:integrase
MKPLVCPGPYEAVRTGECSEQHKDRPITPRTINYEIAVLRTFFYFLIRDRNLPIGNPCANFKQLKDPRVKAKRRPPTYSLEELDRIFAACDEREKTTFATLLLTGLREEELCYLTWWDVELGDLDNATLRVSGEGKQGFSPKDYEDLHPIFAQAAQTLAAVNCCDNPSCSNGSCCKMPQALS